MSAAVADPRLEWQVTTVDARVISSAVVIRDDGPRTEYTIELGHADLAKRLPFVDVAVLDPARRVIEECWDLGDQSRHGEVTRSTVCCPSVVAPDSATVVSAVAMRWSGTH